MLYVIQRKRQVCVERCVKHSVVYRRTESILIPQFQAAKGDRILLKTDFVHEQLLRSPYACNITDAEVANEANPLAMTDLGFTLPDLHPCKEPLQVWIAWIQSEHSSTSVNCE